MFLNTRWAAIVLSIPMTFEGTAAWSQTTAPENSPVPASQPAAKTLKFTEAPLTEVLNAFAEQWGFIIIKPPTLPGRVTLTLDKSLTSTQVAGMLNDMLKPFGYESLASRTTDPNPRTILRIVPSFTIGKSRIPISYGRDPAKIEISDKFITQVIPLEHINVVQARKELEPLLSRDADLTANVEANSLIITDTSVRVRQFLEAVLKLDQAPTTAPTTTSQPATLKFVDAPLTEVLNAYSQHWGFIFIRPPSDPLITATIDKSKTANEAIDILNELLKPFELAAIPARTTETTQKIILRIVWNGRNGKVQIPVYTGRDPAKIEISGKLITQVIPLEHINAVDARKQLAPLLNPNANVTANPEKQTLIITDTSARVRQYLEALLKLDHAPTTSPPTPSTAPAATSR